MASRREIAADWQCAKSWVDRCVARGCPTDSLEAARQWRDDNARRRAPTDQKSLARQVEKQRESNSSEDCTLIPLVTARDMAWRGYDAILDLVLGLPKNVTCDFSNPRIALASLESECTAILCKACEVYAAWSKIRPPLSLARNDG